MKTGPKHENHRYSRLAEITNMWSLLWKKRSGTIILFLTNVRLGIIYCEPLQFAMKICESGIKIIDWTTSQMQTNNLNRQDHQYTSISNPASPKCEKVWIRWSITEWCQNNCCVIFVKCAACAGWHDAVDAAFILNVFTLSCSLLVAECLLTNSWLLFDCSIACAASLCCISDIVISCLMPIAAMLPSCLTAIFWKHWAVYSLPLHCPSVLSAAMLLSYLIAVSLNGAVLKVSI